MGIPSFFAWLRRKYPMIVQRAQEPTPHVANGVEFPADNTAPNIQGEEYDNLYLDMNGIIHPCCHPEDGTTPKSEYEMMLAIFAYIDRVFAMVRPRKLVHMAVDGPAPRAKMNQQRARRFRSAQEAGDKSAAMQAKRAELLARGKLLPPPSEAEANPFDSNCITPGTQFMDRLAHYLEYYIIERMAGDKAWQGIVVILSDASVPGEGEHKIMEYIRQQRGAPGHDPNLRHCIYGADADLIMLGLLSHEPNFVVLREEFRRPTKNPCELCNKHGHKYANCNGLSEDGDDEPDRWKTPKKKTNFLLVKLDRLRHCLQQDLDPFYAVTARSQSQALSTYRRERLIDDWIFLCFFVGNDFLPHLPSLRITEGAIDMLVEVYQKLPKADEDSYLHKDGKINLGRLEMMMAALAKVEDKIFVDRHQAKKKMDKHAMNKRARIDGFKGKLTAQQQYERVHGKDEDETSLWMTALATAENDVDGGKGDAEATAKAAAEKIAAAKMPSWALNPLADVDEDTLAEHEPLEAGISMTAELSSEAQAWLDRKKQRQARDKKAAGPFGPAAATASAAGKGKGKEPLFKPLMPEDTGTAAAAAARGKGGGARGAAAASKKEGGAGQEGAEEEEEEQDDIRLWESGAKERYYRTKFQVSLNDAPFIDGLVSEYLRGLCWVLEYYYQGVPSWSWYFPYHYAPFASDFGAVDVAAVDVSFAPDSTSLKPLEQLLAVFPPASGALIPAPLANLMTAHDSAISKFYPDEFKVDKNGFRHDWQGVTLLPFLDVDKVLAAAASVMGSVDESLRRLNTIGFDRLYVPQKMPLCTWATAQYLAWGAGAGAGAWVELDAALAVQNFGRVQGAESARAGSVVLPQCRLPSVNPGAQAGESIKVSACMVEYRLPATHVVHTSKEIAGTVWPKKPSRRSVTVVDKKDKTCHDFKAGNCKRGDRCRFAHATPGESGSVDDLAAGANAAVDDAIDAANGDNAERGRFHAEIVALEAAPPAVHAPATTSAFAAAAAAQPAQPKKRWRSGGAKPLFQAKPKPKKSSRKRRK